LEDSLITWHSKKQTTIALSISEAEYRTLASATCELQWLYYLPDDLKINCTNLPVLYCDKKSALHIAANLVFHKRTKHLEINCHMVREKLSASLNDEVAAISFVNQIADLFIKALAPQPFSHLIDKLRLINIYQY